MARVYLSKSQRLCNRLRSWICGELKSKGIHQMEIAEHLGISQQAVSAKLIGKATITYEDFLKMVEMLNPDDDDLLWLMGK